MNLLLHRKPSEHLLTRRLAAVAFLDVVGYSRLMAIDEEETLAAWSSLQVIVIEPRIRTWGGRIVDKAGDGIFTVFGSALDALDWALDVQAAVERHPFLGPPMRLRIGLHLTDIIDGPHGEAQGDGVNIAARLQNYAETGGVIVSRAIADEVRGKRDAIFTRLRRRRLKNIARPIHAFHVAAGPAPARPLWRRAIPVTLPLATAATVLSALLLFQPFAGWQGTPRERAERLTQQGLAIVCHEYPCPREWLDQRALFEQAIAVDPSFAVPYAKAALTFTNFIASGLSVAEKDDLREAARLTTRVIALAPDQAFAYMARGAVLRQDPDKLDDALTAYLRAFSIDPSLPQATANAGWLLILLGRPAEAEPYLQQALEMAPKHFYAPAWQNEIGLAELFLGRYESAVRWFQNAIEKEAKNAIGADRELKHKLNLAAALALYGDLKGAQGLIGKLRSERPSLSTRDVQNGSCVCSHALGWLQGMAKLKQGVVLAGALDAG